MILTPQKDQYVMASEARRLAAIKSRQSRERSDLEDKFHAREEAIRSENDRRRLEEHAENRRTGGGRVMAPKLHDDPEGMMIRRNDEKIAALHAERHTARKDLDTKHQKEMTDAMKPGIVAKWHRQPPPPGSPVAPWWPYLSDTQKQAYFEERDRWEAERDKLDVGHADRVERTSRYNRGMSRIDEQAIDAHMKLNDREDRAMKLLAAGFKAEIEDERRRVERQAQERAAMAAKHADESRRRA